MDMEALRERQLGWFRQLHRRPELTNHEFETTALVKRVLTEAGIRLRETGMATGAVAEVGPGGGRVVGLRCDLDALPVQEETGLPYASEIPGRMHACGHDFHTAAMLAAALLLKEAEPSLPGKAVIAFQPAEEDTDGGRRLARSGAVDDAECFVALHTYPGFEPGTLGIKEGPVMAAADMFRIVIRGVGSHAAQPHRAVDPIPVMAALITALQTVVSRTVDPFQPAVLTIGRAQAGTAHNVIPEEAVLEGTLRTLDDGVRAACAERIRQMTESVCAAWGAKGELTFDWGPPAVVNDPGLCETARAVALRDGFTVARQEDTMGGEDFSELLVWPKKRPGLFVRVGTGGGVINHSPRFTANPAALLPASVFLRDLALELMRG